MSKEKVDQIVNLIKKHQPIKAAEIAKIIGLSEDNNSVDTRAIIREALNYGHTIVSHTNQGYKFAESKEDVLQNIKSLQSRIDANQSRIDALTRNWNSQSNDHI